MKQVFQGVRYMHSRKIPHGDLKLSHLIFENNKIESKLKIINFGQKLCSFKQNELNDYQ